MDFVPALEVEDGRDLVEFAECCGEGGKSRFERGNGAQALAAAHHEVHAKIVFERLHPLSGSCGRYGEHIGSVFQ